MCDSLAPPTPSAPLPINARGVIRDGEGRVRRGSITLTPRAVCNLISEAVISDWPAALTRHALPEWQIRFLQLD